MKTQLKSMAFVVGLIAAFAQSGWAQSTLYFDRPGFIIAAQAVPGSQQTISLLDLPSDELGPTLTIADVTFGGRYLLRKIDPAVSTAGPVLFNFDSGVPLSISFANGALAFGADFSSFLSPQYSSFTSTVSLSNGEVFNFSAPTNPDSAFFGFISPAPITHLTFSDGGLFGFGDLHEELIGNIVVVTIPEPSVGSLFVIGGLFMWRIHNRRKS